MQGPWPVEKHTGKTEHFSLKEISAWRQRKINKWATLRKQTTHKAITQHERNKAALRKFNEKWQLFKALPFHDDPQTKYDGDTTSRHSETRTALATPQADRESPRRGTR